MFVKKLIPFAVAASFAMAGATAFAKTEFVTIGTGGITVFTTRQAALLPRS